MTFFAGFPEVIYKYGNEKEFNLAQNLSVYVDIIDRFKDNSSLYTFYNLYDGERPDQVSQMLYGTTDYYWTFFLLNDNLKTKGWPLSSKSLEQYVKNKYDNTTLTTRDYFYDKFKVGDSITGQESTAVGKVISTNSNLGTITVQSTPTFTPSETIQLVGDPNKTVTLHSTSAEYNAVRYYKSGNDIVDIDPTVGPGASLVEVTNLEYYQEQNSENFTIKIFKPETVSGVFAAYKSALRENI